VPFHKGRDISPTLLRQIAKDIGLSVDEFISVPGSDKPAAPQSKTPRTADQD
jgi:hypothetical protein